MAKKNKYQFMESEPMDLIDEVVESPDEVVESPELPAHEEPKLMIEEVASKYIKSWKAHNLAAVVAFAGSQGFPVVGSEEEMKSVLQKYGYSL